MNVVADVNDKQDVWLMTKKKDLKLKRKGDVLLWLINKNMASEGLPIDDEPKEAKEQKENENGEGEGKV